MTKNKNQNIIHTQNQITYMVIQCLSSVEQVNSNGQIPKSLTLIDTSAIVQKVAFLKFFLNILKNYANNIMIIIQPQIKKEIKREILSNYQLKIADLKKLVPNFFDKEKYVLHYENLQLYLRNHRVLELKQKKMKTKMKKRCGT